MSVSLLAKTTQKELLGKYKLPKTTRYVSCIDLHDSKTRDFVIQGLADLGVAVFITGKDNEQSPLIKVFMTLMKNSSKVAIFLVSDSHTSPARITACIPRWHHPCRPKTPHLKGCFRNLILWNSQEMFCLRRWSISDFASVVALLENMKFPADREILLKNVVDTL